jgi:fumarate reductase flavoprotein subunit
MSQKEVPVKWDNEADVIVIGGGNAGLPAGIVAAQEGAKTMLLESRSVLGGSFKMVVGGLAIAGSDEQKEQGIQDSPEIYYQDMVNLCGTEPDIARSFVDNQLEAYRLLKDQGVKFPGLTALPGHSKPRALGWLYGFGPVMVKALEDKAKNTGVNILTKHRGVRLITEPGSGRVIGVKVQVENNIMNFKAKRGVVIASGGFGHNPEIIAEYAPEMVGCLPMMPPSHLGDGLKMAMVLGAATKDMGIAVAPAWPICVETHRNVMSIPRWSGIAVNVNGKRFHEESCSEGFYGPLTGEGLKQPGNIYWMVYDENIRKNIYANEDKGHLADMDKAKVNKADSIEALAKLSGVDATGLTETVNRYNSDIKKGGYDTVFGRKHQWGALRSLEKIEVPPFYSVKCRTALTSMKGGLKINGKCQVLNQYGEIIPSLYAAGEVAGGLHTKTYLLGVMTAGALTQGVISGRNAAKESAW